MRPSPTILLISLLLAGCAPSGVVEEPAERWVVEEIGSHAEFNGMFFLDEQRGWIVGGGHDIAGGILGRTTDGGRSWEFRSGIVQPTPRVSNFHLNAVWFFDEKNGFAAGDGFRVLRTEDGGEHWHRAALRSRFTAHLRDLQFVHDHYGWAVGPGGFARTIDAGESWEVVQYGPRGMALDFIDRDRGWVVGKFGLVSVTTDGGASWTELGGPPATGRPDLWGVDFADERHGWAVGEGGLIQHTADGGISWRRQQSGVPHLLMDVDFLDASRGWAAGFDRTTGSATVLWTADGGATWVEQARVPTEAVRTLFVLDEKHAWAIGEQQRRSENDGSQKLLRYEVDERLP